MKWYFSRGLHFSWLLMLSFSSGAQASDNPWYLGYWQTEGYGYIFNIQKNNTVIFEQTSMSCVVSGLSAGLLEEVASSQPPYFNVGIPGFIDAQMELHQGVESGGKQITFHRNDTNTWMQARRLDELPELCLLPPNPDEALKVFVQNFREHYPFLSRHPELLDKVATTPSQKDNKVLFSTMADMLITLNDPHTALVAPEIEQFFFGSELPNSDVPSASQLQAMRQRVKDHYVVGSLTKLNEQMRIGNLANDIVYLAIDGFWGLSEEATSVTDETAMHQAIEQILTRLKMARGLVIDVRAHSGGSDKLGLQLAASFTDKDYVAYRKQFVMEGGLSPKWKEGAPVMVRGSGVKAWTGNIVVLTSKATVSAGEAFVMALEQRSPKVIKVGDKTRGSFSDTLPRKLPNGWLFALPNERYLNSAGESFDFLGIPPDKLVKKQMVDSDAHKDYVVELAMKLLLK